MLKPGGPPPPDLLVGLGAADDAAVYRLAPDLAIVETVDFFPPVVDDPWTWGAVAAVNAMSDVYAKGGEVMFALGVAVGNDAKGPEEAAGTGTADTTDSTGGLHSSRIRNGFMTSILGFEAEKQVSPKLRVTTRVALWMNASGTRPCIIM